MRSALFALLLVLCVHFSSQVAWEDEGFYPAKNDMIVGTWVSRFRREVDSSESSESKESKEVEKEGSGEGSGSEEEKSRERRESVEEASGEAPLVRFKREVEGSGEAVLSRISRASLEEDVVEASGSDVEGSGAFF
ncbi:hypothetical protein QR680_004913 [Steinernema hermaphroditum]|uniref:Uncharacterized protein n=1 Tax=Steinernema hermaphroditum TaxID=289476 RepID=A0AA39HQ89_9BILA|nr:hypothetical protein QR680_004913 [Steinernema hermaphroditum]